MEERRYNNMQIKEAYFIPDRFFQILLADLGNYYWEVLKIIYHHKFDSTPVKNKILEYFENYGQEFMVIGERCCLAIYKVDTAINQLMNAHWISYHDEKDVLLSRQGMRMIEVIMNIGGNID